MKAGPRPQESIGVMVFVALVALVGLALLFATPSLLVSLFGPTAIPR